MITAPLKNRITVNELHYFVTKPSSFHTVCVSRSSDVSILATTSKHNNLHLDPLQMLRFKLVKREKPWTAYQTGPSGDAGW